MSLDPAALPFIEARWFYASRRRPIRVVVLHTPETPEVADAAERVARYFASTDRKASTHTVVDSDSGVRCVHDHHTAWGARGANADGLHVEIAGTARQSANDWMDAYSLAALDNAADIVADWCRRFDIPVVHLSSAQLKAGEKGIVGHNDVEAAYPSSGHWDPGTGFPFGDFLGMVAARINRQAKVAPMFNPPIPIAADVVAEGWPQINGHVLGHYQLTEHGHLYAWGLASHFGQPAGDPNVAPKNADGSIRTYARFEITPEGYTVVDSNGNYFAYGPR